MNKKGFTLIEVIVSVVLVSVVMVSLLGSLIQIRQTYTVIHENSDIIVYSSSISRVINNDLTKNNGIRYVTCAPDGLSCDMILGNDSKRKLEILRDEKCTSLSGSTISCETNGDKRERVKTTLRYLDTTKREKLLYIRTLTMNKFEKNKQVGASGYGFADMSTTTYEHDNGSTSNPLVDQYTTIKIRLNNEVNEEISKYDIILFTAGRYNYSNLLRQVFTLNLNTNGADYAGTTRIDEVFGVGFFKTEDNHTVVNRLSAANFDLPRNGTKAFLGYYYYPAGSGETTQRTQVIDSTGNVVISSRFFRDHIEPNIENSTTSPRILAEWGDCSDGYEVVNSVCTPKSYTISYYADGTLKETKQVSYLSQVGNVSIPYKTGFKFNGYYYTGSIMFNNDTGNGIYIYGIKGNSRVDATYTACNKAHASTYTANNNNCVVATCEAGYEVEGSGASNSCKAKTYTVTFNANGGSGLSASSKTVTFGEAYGDLPTINSSNSCDNYSFSGWYTARTGGSRVTNTTTVSQTTDHTLWARRSYNGDCCDVGCHDGGVLENGMCVANHPGAAYEFYLSDTYYEITCTERANGTTYWKTTHSHGKRCDKGYTIDERCGTYGGQDTTPCTVGTVLRNDCNVTCWWDGDYAPYCN